MDLERILEGLPREFADPNVLVGFDHADDAAVYRLDDERALVMTLDVITPIVDDPRSFGAVAATNAITDVYAMGGRPLMALNIACLNPELPHEVYRELLAGAADAAKAQGCPILGGHTVKDAEIKFGLAVVGEVHPDRIVTNAGAQPGDALVLNKPLGTAAVATAFKRGALTEEDVAYQEFLASMLLGAREAVALALDANVHAMTDITGFGLSGHAIEMAEASGVTLRIKADDVPVLRDAKEFLENGFLCGGTDANAERAEGKVRWPREIPEGLRAILHDAQTSGPLLVAVPSQKAATLVEQFKLAGYPYSKIIGEVIPGGGVPIEVL